MKENLRRLNRIVKIFGADSFYVVSATEYNVRLQGLFKNKTMLKAAELKFVGKIEESGYLSLTRGKYTMVLTD